MKIRLVLAAATFILAAAATTACAQPSNGNRGREPIVGGPCEGCENVFVGMPAELRPISRIAPKQEPGDALRIEGVVRGRDGEPAAGVIVYAYHTDAKGIYPRAETRHGRLRGWARTDADGRYRFDTIHPAGYPGRNIPAHVHMHVIEVGRCTYYIDDIHFVDDPRLSAADRRRTESGRAGSGLVRPRPDGSGGWIATRDIDLGKNTPACPPG